MQTHVSLGPETVTNGSASDFPGHQSGEEGVFQEETFKERLQVTVQRVSALQIELDVVGVDASVANAIRRTLLAEVPTVAVEQVYIWNNTSIVQDEVLAQRLGLVPLAIDPKKLEFKTHGDEPTDLNTIVFSLISKCERIRGDGRNLVNSEVYSSAFNWQPKGIQSETFGGSLPRPVHDDILLAKMRANQEILLEMHCEKGIGKDHAKWSPVATASYRLLPTIVLHQPIPPHLQERLKACFSPGVAEIRPNTKGDKELAIVNPRMDTVSREALRHPDLRDFVTLGRKRDHYIYNIESCGQYRSADLLPTALEVLLSKVKSAKSHKAQIGRLEWRVRPYAERKDDSEKPQLLRKLQ